MGRRVSLRSAVLWPLVSMVAAAAMLVVPTRDTPSAGAQAQNRAAVIVHTGGGSAAVCVRFSEPTITGLEALRRAGLGAVIRSFSGEGSAVCGINGTGCPADGSCLTCQAPNYWAYHRAAPGAGGFTYASGGAGATQVTDGSVEGWQWGTGAAPPFQTVDQVCGDDTPPPTPRPTNPPSGAPATPGGSGGGEGTDSPAAPSSVTTSPVGSTTTDVTTTSAGPLDGSSDGEGRSTTADAELTGDLASAQSPDSTSGSPWAVGLFVALLAGIAGAAAVVRRRRAM